MKVGEGMTFLLHDNKGCLGLFLVEAKSALAAVVGPRPAVYFGDTTVARPRF